MIALAWISFWVMMIFMAVLLLAIMYSGSGGPKPPCNP